MSEPTGTVLLLQLLDHMGLSRADVQAALGVRGLGGGESGGPGRTVTVDDFYRGTVLPMARSARPEDDRGGGLVRTYEPYWHLFVEGYPYPPRGARQRGLGTLPDERLFPGLGHKPVSAVTRADVVEAVRWTTIRATLNAHWRTVRRDDLGRPARPNDQKGAVRNCVGALRYFFRLAQIEGLLQPGYNPVSNVSKPPRAVGNRRAFTEAEYGELWATIVSGGDDPELDALLVETVAVTGARREGLINLDVRDLRVVRGTLILREKYDTVVEQPATTDLVARLEEFARSRGARRPSDPVFCYADSVTRGAPHRLTSRRFDTLHQRIQREIDWADDLGVTLHWWRHHAITTIERIAGTAVAIRFARHTPKDVTARYSTASFEEVCRAVGVMTGGQHPLARDW